MHHQVPPSESPLGRILIANAAVEQVVANTVPQCYGVVGMGARGGRVGRLIARARPTFAVDARQRPDGLAVTIDVVVEQGLNLAEVAATVRSHVAYEVERLTGLRVAAVEVRISHVQRSA
jgi:uncharacterized alkaline shock family protein YloU